MPEIKTLIRKPTEVIQHLVAYAEYRLNELEIKQTDKCTVIVTGKIDVGKTSFVQQLIEAFKEKQLKVSGIYSRKVYENNKRIGYDLVDIKTNTFEPFLQINGKQRDGIGMFKILPRGLQFGIESLKSANNGNSDIVIVDEIGKLELSGKGWIGQVKQLITLQQTHLLLVINEKFLEEFSEQLDLKNTLLITIPTNNFSEAFERIYWFYRKVLILDLYQKM
ncbi:MAG: DUF2478 domain-containing protein [Chloroflexia bacterium]|nr:DUF2478 domain-containing protein [Chloroflexia bacterium]